MAAPRTRLHTNPQEWISQSAQVASAFALAKEAHGSQRRATDRALFLDHVLEVAVTLHDEGERDELVAAGLLHDSVERGTLTPQRLRQEMGDEVTEVVLALSEDESIASFSERKAALRKQVEAAGPDALTVFAADKLSDIRGLRAGLGLDSGSIEERMGITVAGMTEHYRESVDLIESAAPELAIISALRRELGDLALQDAPGAEHSRPEISTPP